MTGGCGCGAVRFEIDAPLQGALYCHCTRCQHRSGTAAAASARAAPGSVRVLSGQEHLRRWLPEGGLAKDFCGECGSAVFASDPESGEVIAVRLGAFDGDPGVRPSARQFVAYAAPWEPVIDCAEMNGCRADGAKFSTAAVPRHRLSGRVRERAGGSDEQAAFWHLHGAVSPGG